MRTSCVEVVVGSVTGKLTTCVPSGETAGVGIKGGAGVGESLLSALPDSFELDEDVDGMYSVASEATGGSGGGVTTLLFAGTS